MSLKMSKTRIDKSYVNISLPHDNSTGWIQQTPYQVPTTCNPMAVVGTFDMVMFAANF